MRRAALLLALAACSGGQKKDTPRQVAAPPDAGPPPIPERLQEEVEAAITLITDLAVAAEGAMPASDEDCTAQAAAMRPVADGEHGKAVLTLDEDAEFSAHAMEINAQYGDRLDAASDRLMDALERCAYHPDVISILVDIGAIQAPPDDFGAE